MAKANFSFPIIYPDLKIGTIDFKFRQIIQSRRDDIIIKFDNDTLKPCKGDMIMCHEIKPIYFRIQQKNKYSIIH